MYEVATCKKLAAEWGLKVDPEFKNLLEDHSQEEKALFEESLLRDGCRDAIVVWEGKNIVVDGHHRLDFCQANDIEFAVDERPFKDRDAAKEWIIFNQLARRNLPMHQKARLALAYKPIIEARAKRNQGTRNDICQISDRSRPADTKHELAKIAGVSHDTIAKVEKIEEEAPAEIRDASRKGEISVNAAYQVAKLPEEAKQEVTRRIEGGEKPKEVVRDVINASKKEDDMEATTVPAVEEKKGVSGNPNGFHRSVRERRAEIRSIGENMRNVSTTPMFTIDDLLYDIRLNADIYFDLLKNTINDRPELLTDENKRKIEDTIDNYVLEGIANVRRSIRNAVQERT